MQFFWLVVAVLCYSPFSCIATEPNKSLEEQVLLFLSDDDPPLKDPKILLAENQVMPPPMPGLNCVPKRNNKNGKTPQATKKNGAAGKQSSPRKPLPRLLFDHQKIQDVESRSILAPDFTLQKKNGSLTVSGKYRPEMFYGRNIALLNSSDEFDKVFLMKQTLDLTLRGLCGPKKYNYSSSELKFTLRNKGVWGNYSSIAPTSESCIKDIDAKFGAHRHFIGRHVVWVREVWFKTLLNAALDLDANYKHYFTIGYYPFKLGRGIALGDAYAVSPSLLGFYTDNVVDQYAPGMVLGGELIKDALVYDIYFAILENNSNSLRCNSEPIYLQRFGRRNCPQRGFGSINWLLAARFEGVVLKSKEYGTLELQPYLLYNHAPEQTIEFKGDGSSSLFTAGVDVNYKNGQFECGFEAAQNLGSQDVFGWDRNHIITELDPTSACVRHVNSHVLTVSTNAAVDGTKALDTKSNQAIINSAIQAQARNGQLISPNLRNASNRFSDPYNTPFRGWMAVADAGYWLFDKQLQIAFAGGIASGDENPNVNLDDPKSSPGDGIFDGFVGLQEVFSGGRVESAFFLGQRIPRPLSLPEDALNSGLFASSITGFSNLVYLGTGLHVKPDWERKPYWRPNLMFFWQQKATRAFDCSKKKRSISNARSFLGTEINSFFNMTFADCIGATIVGAVFIPGGHYADIKGIPLNNEQLKLLLFETPDVASRFLLNTDPAFLLNVVLEYRF